MIERKRRNDFVRKREFDMLRKMRRSEVMAGQDPAARPSFFQSSMPSKPDDRATTLKKIDEIEAQMSMQWWKTKHGDRRAAPAAAPTSRCRRTCRRRSAAPAAAQRARAHAAPRPQPLTAEPMPERPTAPPMLDAATAAPVAPAARPTAPAAHAGCPTAPLPVAAPRGRRPRPRPAAGVRRSGRRRFRPEQRGFSASKLFAIDVDEFAHDPELEEAAIRFANGDDAGAEAGLMEVLGPSGRASTTTRPG